MCKSPLAVPMRGSRLPKKIVAIRNHQNAIASFEYCRRALFNAEIYKCSPHKKAKLRNRIELSPHFYCDIIHSIAQIPQSDNDLCIHFLALLYEALTYKANKDAPYPETV
jgi:hypothetical protein